MIKTHKACAGASLIAAVAIGLTACGTPATPPPDDPSNDGAAPVRRPAMPSVESEIGAMDAAKVQAIFDAAGPELKQCYVQGVSRIGFLGGDIRLAIRVDENGAVKRAYVKESTLGDRVTEACMLGILKKRTWPKPQGGKEGTADTSYGFDPGDEERPPVEWSESSMGDAYRNAKGALSKCRSDAGAGPMKATLYVETDGKALGVGVSGADPQSEDAAGCIVEVLKGVKYASPGSYAAKVTIDIE